jgi:hypothetical protein
MTGSTMARVYVFARLPGSTYFSLSSLLSMHLSAYSCPETIFFSVNRRKSVLSDYTGVLIPAVKNFDSTSRADYRVQSFHISFKSPGNQGFRGILTLDRRLL